MSKKTKSKAKTRAEPAEVEQAAPSALKIWLNSDGARAILCPDGYTPLSKNEEVRKCIHKVADMVSNMTIMLMKNGENGDIRIKNELAKKIDIYPNLDMVRKNFIYKIATDMMVNGNSLVLPKVRMGIIENLKILKSDCASYADCEESYIITYRGKVLYPDELLHFVLIPDDDNPYRGVGFTSLIKGAVETLLQAQATKKGFLKSEWKPSLIMTTEADSEELKDKDLRRKIVDSYTKTTEIGEPWIIPAGQIDIKEVRPLTLNDLAIQDSIKLDVQAIAAAIGLPAFMVGVGTFNKDEYNNFIATTIMSIATIIQQELSKKLLFAPDLYFKFNPKSLMQYTLAEKAGFVKEMVSGGMLNRNEGRVEFDYPPVDDAGMNEYYVLENYLPVARLGDQKKLEGGEGIEA